MNATTIATGLRRFVVAALITGAATFSFSVLTPDVADARPISPNDRAKAQAVKQQRLDSDCGKLDADTDKWRDIANDTSKSDKERKDAADAVMSNLEFGLILNCTYAGGTGVPR